MKYKEYVLPKTKRQRALNKGFLLKILQQGPHDTQNLPKSRLLASQGHSKKKKKRRDYQPLIFKGKWQNCMTGYLPDLCTESVPSTEGLVHGGRETENGRLVSVPCECSCPISLKPSATAWETWKYPAFSDLKTYETELSICKSGIITDQRVIIKSSDKRRSNLYNNFSLNLGSCYLIHNSVPVLSSSIAGISHLRIYFQGSLTISSNLYIAYLMSEL